MWQRMRRISVFLFLAILLTGQAGSQEEADIEGAQLVDLPSSGIGKIGTFCTVVDQLVKRSINARDFIEGQKALSTEEDGLYRTYADIFFDAQQESGVSFDDISSEDVAAFMVAMQQDYDDFLLYGYGLQLHQMAQHAGARFHAMQGRRISHRCALLPKLQEGLYEYWRTLLETAQQYETVQGLGQNQQTEIYRRSKDQRL